MNFNNETDFANRELSIDELDAVAAAGLWGFIKHEASAVAHWVEGEAKAVGDFIKSVAVGPGGTVYANRVPHKVS